MHNAGQARHTTEPGFARSGSGINKTCIEHHGLSLEAIVINKPARLVICRVQIVCRAGTIGSLLVVVERQCVAVEHGVWLRFFILEVAALPFVPAVSRFVRHRIEAVGIDEGAGSGLATKTQAGIGIEIVGCGGDGEGLQRGAATKHRRGVGT